MLRAAFTSFRSHISALHGLRSSSSLFSEAEALERFGKWCRRYRRAYSSEEEKLYRFNVFKENLEQLARENPHDIPEYGNCLADRTSEEFRRYYCGGSSLYAAISRDILYRAVRSAQGLFKK